MILIVDDDVGVSTVLRRYLERCGQEVKVCNNPMVALDWLDASGIRPATIISDIDMPEMGGIEFLRRADEILGAPTPRMVVLTGRFEDDAGTEEVGTWIDVAFKPFDLPELAQLIGIEPRP